MTKQQDKFCLNHQFLIAMPGEEESTFSKTVIYVCEHNDDGAVGLVINRLSELSIGALVESSNITLVDQSLRHKMVFNSGPVESTRGFVLHSSMDFTEVKSGESTEETEENLDPVAILGKAVFAVSVRIGGQHDEAVDLTTSKDILEAIAQGSGPKRYFVGKGCSGWVTGQLESEMARNCWLSTPANLSVLFDVPVEERYAKALALLGLSEAQLYLPAGRA